ncbi:phage gp6-like head-tail connector protein [Altericroceibacterium spongiae]|uniref:Phage gp6-like head-tail connector protein n=1 Tax=Altericroceibacterium spongiae TaxID=2320269 RepID=A0A420ERX3_9SPHN|nr:head-tail connector protein [Altericroceibacterium spongiae]RKF23373.1 phage gp6-like head-tail connector protein [Altericroceibacterium spongiae]
MRTVAVNEPAPVITLAEAKEHLRVDSDDEDALITGMVAAATAHISGPDGYLNRVIGVQMLQTYLARFPGSAFRLPYGPVRTITSVEYRNGEVWQAIDQTDYELNGNILEPVPGVSWPSFSLTRREHVRVLYEAGYETAPFPVKAAIFLMVGDLYANRETVVTGTIASEVPMPTAVKTLLEPYRDYR